MKSLGSFPMLCLVLTLKLNWTMSARLDSKVPDHHHHHFLSPIKIKYIESFFFTSCAKPSVEILAMPYIMSGAKTFISSYSYLRALRSVSHAVIEQYSVNICGSISLNPVPAKRIGGMVVVGWGFTHHGF